MTESGPKTEGFTGVWRTKTNHGPHRDVKAFKPASAAEAKAFLIQESFKLPERVSKFFEETPRTSRTEKWQGRAGKMPCHGCHGPMGGGAHNGSAPGMNICTLQHHSSCPGGIQGDVSWRACPVLSHQQVSQMGFESTLSSQDFVQTQAQSTPMSNQQIPGIRQVSGNQQSSSQHLPSLNEHEHQITPDMQNQIDSHRAMNQGLAENMDRPSMEDLTIRDLRADRDRQNLVTDQMQGFQEQIPSLFHRPTASVPQVSVGQSSQVAPSVSQPASSPQNISSVGSSSQPILPPLPAHGNQLPPSNGVHQQPQHVQPSQQHAHGIPPPMSTPSSVGNVSTPAMPSQQHVHGIPTAHDNPLPPSNGGGHQQGAHQQPQHDQPSQQQAHGIPPANDNPPPPSNGVGPPRGAHQQPQHVQPSQLHANGIPPPMPTLSSTGNVSTPAMPRTSGSGGPAQPANMNGQTYTVSSHQTTQPAYVPQYSTSGAQYNSSTAYGPQYNPNTPLYIPSTAQYSHGTGPQVTTQPPVGLGQDQHDARGVGSVRVPSQPGHVGRGVPHGSPVYVQQGSHNSQVFVPQPQASNVRGGLPVYVQQGSHPSQTFVTQPQASNVSGPPSGTQQQQSGPGFPSQLPYTTSHTAPQPPGQQTGQYLPQQFIQQPPHGTPSRHPAPQQQVHGHWPGQQQPHQQPHHQPGSISYTQAYQGQSNASIGQQSVPGMNNNYVGGAASLDNQHIPVMNAPLVGAQPIYEYVVDINGKTCTVLRQTQPHSLTRTEYRCSPQSGRVYPVQVPVQPTPPQTLPSVKRYEWRCDPHTGFKYQVELPATQQSPYASGQLPPPMPTPPPPPPVRKFEWRCDPQTGNSYQVEVPATPSQLQQQPQHLPSWSSQPGAPQPASLQQQYQRPEDFDQQLQKQMKGIVQLCEGGVAKKAMKTIEFAKKGSAKWAKKVTVDSINLPLFTLGAISELESSLSGRTEKLSDDVFLAKLCHIKNYLDVCCLNSEPTDFKGYGWSIAKDYALKVEGEVEQNITSWEEMPGGVQTSQLLLAQMDCPKPSKPAAPTKGASGTYKEKEGPQVAKARCPSFNSCKSKDKCEYEVSNPDKKCLFKHECNWCKNNLKQSWRHQEWNCQNKKN